MPAEENSRHGAHGVERLRHVEAPCGRVLRPHRNDVGVGGCLKHCAPPGHHIDGKQEKRVGGRVAGREEEHCAGRVERKPEEDSRLVR